MKNLSKQDRSVARTAPDVEKRYRLNAIRPLQEDVEAMKEDMVVDSTLSSTSTHPVENQVITKALANKVNKENGKGLSTNDFTNSYKKKLDSIETIADYDALPVGAIVDFEGDTIPTGYEEVADPDVYSTSEKVVGTWVNGAPVYRKVIFYDTKIAGATTVQIPHNIANLKSVIKCDYIVKWDGKNYPSPVIYSEYTKQLVINFIGTSYIYVKSFGETWDAYTLTIILEYLKTTD